MTGNSSSTQRPKRFRNGPFPHSILDRKELIKALERENIACRAEEVVKDFYQALHREHYPDLPEFVDRYYQNEKAVRQRQPNGRRSTTVLTEEIPLKNDISKKKNRNRKQMPKAFLQFLATTKDFVTLTSTVDLSRTSQDGSTTKIAVRLYDGQLVESVLMRYVTQDGCRASLCVSSQCGCAMKCSFCATGTMGLSGNLISAEILEQLIHADRILAKEHLERTSANASTTSKKNNKLQNLNLVRNVVFMGMGEPLDNYNNVLEACRALIDPKRWNLAHGRVTVSTVGITPKIRQLTRELPEVSLAVSLHAPNQAMRTAIVPTAKAYPIEGIVDALDGHMKAYLKNNNKPKESSTRRRAMIEYVMLEGDTSSLECAHQLGKLTEHRNLVVNLIPYNQTDVEDELRCPPEEHVQEFRRIVTSYGTFCTVRRTMGADIASACGQLVVNKQKKQTTTALDGAVADIEDVVVATGKKRSALSSSTPIPRQQPKTVAGVGRVTTAPTARPSEECNSGPEEPPARPQEPSSSEDTRMRLERLIVPLAIATVVATSCFVVSGIMFARQRFTRR